MPALRDLLLRETTTIGLRWRMENKLALAREFQEVETGVGKGSDQGCGGLPRRSPTLHLSMRCAATLRGGMRYR